MTSLIRYTFELFLNGAWVDVTTWVRHQKVVIKTGNADESPKITPGSAKLTFHSPDGRFNPDNPLGPYYGQLIRNTPIRISTVSTPDEIRFVGEIFSMNSSWNEDGSDYTVSIEAASALRRMIGRKAEPTSYYRSWWQNQGPLDPWPTPRFFWPLEEGSDSGGAQPDIGTLAATLTNAPSRPVWGQAKMNDWIPDGVAIDNLNTLTFPCDSRGWATDAWEMSCILTFPNNESVALFEIDCQTETYYVYIYNQSPNWDDALFLVVSPAGAISGPLFANPANLKDLGPVWLNFRLDFTGSIIHSFITAGAVSTQSNSVFVGSGGTHSALGAVYPRSIKVSASSNTASPATATANFIGLSALSVSECSIGSVQMNLSYIQTKGNPSEATYDRFARLCADAGLNAGWFTDGGATMGKQYIQTLEEHFEEILASSKHSAISEWRSTGQAVLMTTGFHWGNIDYSDLFGIEPASDDQLTTNILTVANSHGETVTLTKATGEMSVAAIGPFDSKIEPNNRKMAHALAIAGTRLELGTWTGPRFLSVTLSARSRPALYGLLRKPRVGDYFTLTGMSSVGYYDDLVMKILQCQETITHEDHTFTFLVRPGEVDYQHWECSDGVVDGLMDDVVDIDDSTVAVASSGATVDVNVPTAKWTFASGVFDIMISGERMTVTGVATLTATTQRLTVTRAINGVVKTVPVGSTVHTYPAYFIKAVS